MARSSDGMFRLRQPSTDLPFTGERLTRELHGQVELEHLHRYCFARDLCAGRDVLDVASGEGYGSAILATVARSVVGVELSVEATTHAKAAYPEENLEFISGDATQIPLSDATVDVVVSFETLEHLPDQDKFFNEVRRVLRPGGLLIVSTPDRHVHSGIGMGVNPFHVHELSYSEFETSLSAHFPNWHILPQRALIGSALLNGTDGLRTYEKRDSETIEATTGLARAVYLIGIASEAPLPPVPSSVFADQLSVDAVFQQLFTAQKALRLAEANAQNVEAVEKSFADTRESDKAALEAKDAEIRNLRYALKQASDKTVRFHELSSEADELRARAADAVLQRDAIVNSSIWRATRPLRSVAKKLPAPARRGIKRVARGVLRIARRTPPALNPATTRPAISPAAFTKPLSLIHI